MFVFISLILIRDCHLLFSFLPSPLPVITLSFLSTIFRSLSLLLIIFIFCFNCSPSIFSAIFCHHPFFSLNSFNFLLCLVILLVSSFLFFSSISADPCFCLSSLCPAIFCHHTSFMLNSSSFLLYLLVLLISPFLFFSFIAIGSCFSFS